MANTSKITILALVFCIFYMTNTFANLQTANQEPNKPAYLKPISPDELKEDLDFLFKTIEEVHPNIYAYTSKEEFAPIRDKLYAKINGPLTTAEFYRLVAPAVASLKSFHTYIAPFGYRQYVKSGGRVFPLQLQWDEREAVLVKNHSSIPLPIGGVILTINGRNAEQLFTTFSTWIAAENKTRNPWLLGNPVFLRSRLLLEFGPVEKWTLKIKANDGTSKLYSVPSLALSEFRTDQDTVTVEVRRDYRVIPEYNAALIVFTKWLDHEGFALFLDEVFKDIHVKKIANLMIDIRENTGGSDQCFHKLLEYLTARPYKLYEKFCIKISDQTRDRIIDLRRELPDKFANAKNGDIITIELPAQKPTDNPFRFNDNVFLLIGRRSFSASTVFASAVKYADIATLIGEETGDPTTLYADSIEFKLPHSGLQAWVPSKLLVCAGGKPDGRGVIPHSEVKQKPEDTAKGIDTVLQFTLNMIKSSEAEK